MARVLLIDRDGDSQHALGEQLRCAGHEVTFARRADEGIRIAHDTHPDLVIVDHHAPGEDGTAVCRALRWEPGTRTTPVMVLSDSDDPIDRIVTLEVGAHDFVKKPFSLREVVLRARAILRRSASVAVEKSASMEQYGPLRIDRAAHRVWMQSREVRVSRRELRLLLELVDSKGQVLERRRLVHDLWGKADDTGDASRALDTAVKRLRRKLGRNGSCIVTVRGVGYRFSNEQADVTVR